MRRKMLGRKAEDMAVRFLKNTGLRVLGRNFTSRIGEIDIIARDGSEVVFVEVRSSRGYIFYDPIESITPAKIGRLQRLALVWLGTKGLDEEFVRFDVITVVFFEDESSELKHYKNAF